MNPLSFKLTIKDYDSSSPLKDKEIQITNIDSKKCYESKFTTSNGEVLFEIPKNEKGDFFSVKLINDNDYEVNPYYLAKESSNTHKNASTSSNTNNSPESKNTTNKILTPNNYQKYPATLYFKANISLYFNGFTLFVMQGDKEIASYESHTNATLENGTYFISTQEIKDLSKTYESSKSNESNHSNNTNFSNIDSNDSNNTDSTQSNNLFCNIFKDESLRQQCYKIYNSTQNAVDDNIICSNDFFANIDKIVPLINIMQYVKCIIDYKPNLIKSIKIQGYNSSVFVDLNAPFAAGTFIKLEAIKSSDESNIGTIYWKEELCAKKTNAKNFKIISHKSRKVFIIGQCTQAFYLSTPKELDYLRQNGYVEFKYIIHASSIKCFNKNTAHIKFNLNFAVGIGNDDNVSESQRDIQSKMQNGNILNSDDINEWNKLQHICSVDEAVQFLRANLKNKNNQNLSAFDYFRLYPQLAGKIAYIYYRFDLGNEKFIKSVTSDNEMYVKDREKYIKTTHSILLNYSIGRTKQTKIVDEYKKLLKANDTNLNKDFIDRSIRRVCKVFDLPLKDVVFEFDKGFGKYENQIIYINGKLLSDLNGRIKTAFHEVRHFYIEQYYTPQRQANQSILKKYIYYSLQFYIEVNVAVVFEIFGKICDDDDFKNIGCEIGKYQDIYKIQPNERDPRYVATQIANILPKGL